MSAIWLPCPSIYLPTSYLIPGSGEVEGENASSSDGLELSTAYTNYPNEDPSDVIRAGGGGNAAAASGRPRTARKGTATATRPKSSRPKSRR